MKLKILLLLFLPIVLFAQHAITEKIYRKARYTAFTWYSGEDASNHYIWQPETFCYKDTSTTNETWVIVFKPGQRDFFSAEHASTAWSNDGSRLGFFESSVGRISSNPRDGASHRWIVNTDGSKLKSCEGYGKGDEPLEGFGWMNTVPASYVSYGTGSSDTTGSAAYTLYKMDLDANNVVSTPWSLNTTSGSDNTKKELVKYGVSSTDEWILSRSLSNSSLGTTDPNTTVTSNAFIWIGLDGTPAVDHAYGFGRNIDDWDADHTLANEAGSHDAWLIGNTWAMIDYSAGDIFAIMAKSGHSTDGGPSYEHWDGDSWGTYGEVRVVAEGTAPFQNPYSPCYWGHPSPSRWADYLATGLTEDDTNYKGMRIFDFLNWVFLSGYVMFGNEYDGNHQSWAGWSDYLYGCEPSGEDLYCNSYLNRYAYNQTKLERKIVETVSPYGGGDYNTHPRPVESPDGTKVCYAMTMLNSSYIPYIQYSVAYYPYPPQITSCTATGGTVSVRFDWQQYATPRTYTTRGWPNSAHKVCPPREIKYFRLWRSTDHITWLPEDTLMYSIYSKYNFQTGHWIGSDSTWTITDAPGNGTWYYMVTSIENSGIESKKPSNIYSIVVSAGSGTGASHVTYPTDPGLYTNPDTSYISSVFDTVLTSYYNIYANDGSAPGTTSRDKVYSISKNTDYNNDSLYSYVDPLGKTDGTTQYKVTAMDTQGNESGALTGITVTHQKSPATTAGQYTIEWTGLYANISGGDGGPEPPVVPPGKVNVGGTGKSAGGGTGKLK